MKKKSRWKKLVIYFYFWRDQKYWKKISSAYVSKLSKHTEGWIFFDGGRGGGLILTNKGFNDFFGFMLPLFNQVRKNLKKDKLKIEIFFDEIFLQKFENCFWIRFKTLRVFWGKLATFGRPWRVICLSLALLDRAIDKRII